MQVRKGTTQPRPQLVQEQTGVVSAEILGNHVLCFARAAHHIDSLEDGNDVFEEELCVLGPATRHVHAGPLSSTGFAGISGHVISTGVVGVEEREDEEFATDPFARARHQLRIPPERLRRDLAVAGVAIRAYVLGEAAVDVDVSSVCDGGADATRVVVRWRWRWRWWWVCDGDFRRVGRVAYDLARRDAREAADGLSTVGTSAERVHDLLHAVPAALTVTAWRRRRRVRDLVLADDAAV